jgi:hypothetical protein
MFINYDCNMFIVQVTDFSIWKKSKFSSFLWLHSIFGATAVSRITLCTMTLSKPTKTQYLMLVLSFVMPIVIMLSVIYAERLS